MGKRLADLTVPRFWPSYVLAAFALGQWLRRRDLRSLEAIGGDLGTTLGTRIKEQDERDDEMIALSRKVADLTAKLTWLTIAIVFLTIVALVKA